VNWFFWQKRHKPVHHAVRVVKLQTLETASSSSSALFSMKDLWRCPNNTQLGIAGVKCLRLQLGESRKFSKTGLRRVVRLDVLHQTSFGLEQWRSFHQILEPLHQCRVAEQCRGFGFVIVGPH
jgi:hypothetical protein